MPVKKKKVGCIISVAVGPSSLVSSVPKHLRLSDLPEGETAICSSPPAPHVRSLLPAGRRSARRNHSSGGKVTLFWRDAARVIARRVCGHVRSFVSSVVILIPVTSREGNGDRALNVLAVRRKR